MTQTTVSSIHDLAHRLGLSSTTVWRALNNQTRISDKTRKRVLIEAKRCNYRPSMVAQALSSGRSQTLGMVLPSIANPIFAKLSRSVEDSAFEKSYGLLLCNTDLNLAREQAQLDLLKRRHVEGLFLVPFLHRTDAQKKHWQALAKENLPMVVLHHRLPGLNVPQVVPDNMAGAALAVEHLLQLGHRRIAFAHGGLSRRYIPLYERYRGFAQTMRAHGLPLNRSHIRQVGSFDTILPGSDAACDQQAIESLMQSHDAPTAIFVPSDMLAVRMMRILMQMGMRVPEDVSVVGFDDSPLASLSLPSLTTVCPPVSEIGRQGALRLFERIEQPMGPCEIQALPCTLKVRESTGQCLSS